MVVGFNPEAQLARFDEQLRVPEYSRGEVSAEEKQRVLDHYNQKDGIVYDSFEQCYGLHGKEWNSNRYRKDEDDVWREYTTYNPDSKWDYYTLGGNWNDYLKLKPGKKGITRKSRIFGDIPGTYHAFKKDIDLNAMYAEAAEAGRKHYQEVLAACGGVIPKLEISAPDRRTGLPTNSDYKTLWEEYFNQESVKLFKEKVSNHPFGPELDDYQCTEEEYVQDSENAAISTFAYLLNGTWHQRGEAGWFASVGNITMSQVEWNKHMREMVDALPDDTLISIYDCHI